ncbi:MAG: alpha/beta hydrolase [Deferrisomatales bacterium]|nr:alpha/beta hydrolase [Deferrisomatales bacterium]
MVTVVHGLNNRPGAMDPLITRLNGQGYHALRLSLHGYEEPPERVEQWWCEVVRRGHAEARARAPDLPLGHLSYSLGSLVAVESFREDPATVPEACVFLAPALALTGVASLIRLIALLRPFPAALRSKTPAEVRARDATPLVEYRAMLRLLDRSPVETPTAAASAPTLVLMSPADGAVSYRKVSALLRRPGLRHWHLHPVRPAQGTPDHHLLISAEAVGETCWEEIVGWTLAHLLAHLH